MMQSRPDAQQRVVAHAGHYLPLEAPAEEAQGIEQFLSSISPSAATP
jgi:pimeloyl-ACP methyl ester carboxylesterase